MEIIKIIKEYILDILIILGLLLMNIPFYAIGIFVGIGVTGAILFAIGVFFAVNSNSSR